MNDRVVRLTVNDRPAVASVEARKSLLDFLRDDAGLTGTHTGCEQGVCGCCNVILDGVLVRSCLVLVQEADGGTVETVEGLADEDELSPLQQAFCDRHALQCGYCTPGMLMAATALMRENPHPDREEIVDALSGTLCRCTGYQQILDAIGAVLTPAGSEVA